MQATWEKLPVFAETSKAWRLRLTQYLQAVLEWLVCADLLPNYLVSLNLKEHVKHRECDIGSYSTGVIPTGGVG